MLDTVTAEGCKMSGSGTTNNRYGIASGCSQGHQRGRSVGQSWLFSCLLLKLFLLLNNQFLPFEDVTEDGQDRFGHSGSIRLQRFLAPNLHDGLKGQSVCPGQVLQRIERFVIATGGLCSSLGQGMWRFKYSLWIDHFLKQNKPRI